MPAVELLVLQVHFVLFAVHCHVHSGVLMLHVLELAKDLHVVGIGARVVVRGLHRLRSVVVVLPWHHLLLDEVLPLLHHLVVLFEFFFMHLLEVFLNVVFLVILCMVVAFHHH